MQPAMHLAYVLIFLLHLSASTCHATSRNQHLLFAGRADDGDAAALLPVAIHHHHHHHRHTTKVLPGYNDVLHYHPATMMARWRGAPPPRPPLPTSVELAGVDVGAAPPRSSPSMVEPSGGIEGAPPPTGKRDTSGAMEPSPSPMPSPRGEGASSSESEAADSGTTEQEESASGDVGGDYEGPKTHPPSHN